MSAAMSDGDRIMYQKLLEESKQVSKEEVEHEETNTGKAGKDERIILILVDDSENSQRAFEYALKNVLTSSGKDVAHLVHHYNISSPSEFAPVAIQAMAHEKKSRRAKGIELLKRLGKLAHDKKVQVKANLLSGGDLREAVLEYSDKLKPEMLVVGCRGHGSLKRALLGSLSTHLVHHSTVPVLVVR